MDNNDSGISFLILFSLQVYEYYISHALAKSFESLFGTVTCLPGCFSLYRIKTFDSGKNKSKPFIIHPDLIKEYADNKVDTLHKKNLLHLGRIDISPRS